MAPPAPLPPAGPAAAAVEEPAPLVEAASVAAATPPSGPACDSAAASGPPGQLVAMEQPLLAEPGAAPGAGVAVGVVAGAPSPSLSTASSGSEIIAKGPAATSVTHRAEWMSFSRECSNAGRCPPDTMSKFRDKAQRQQLFQDWLYNGKNAQTLSAKYKRLETFRRTLSDRLGYRTRDDLLSMYHQKSDMVDDLISRKTTLGHWRPHPEFPSSVDMTQYWVRLDTSLSDDHEQSESVGFDFIGEVDGRSIQNFQMDMEVPGLRPADTGAPGQIVFASAVGAVASPQVGKKAAAKAVRKSPPVPDTALKRGNLLLKGIDKTVGQVRSLIMRLGSLKYQTELRANLETAAKKVEAVYNDVQRLTRDRCNVEAEYEPLLAKYNELKANMSPDMQEAEGVISGAMKPAKKPAKAKAKAKASTQAKTEA